MGHLLMFNLKFKSWIDSIMRVMSCKTTFGQIVTLNEKCRLRMWHRSRHCTVGNFREFSNNSAWWEIFHDFFKLKNFPKRPKNKNNCKNVSKYKNVCLVHIIFNQTKNYVSLLNFVFWPMSKTYLTYQSGFCQYCPTLTKSRIPMYLEKL